METLRDETDQIQAVLDSFLFYNKEELDRLGREDMMREGYEKGVEQGLEQGVEQRNIEIVKKILQLIKLILQIWLI